MQLNEVMELLESNPQAPLNIVLPSGEFVPQHFHVTEVGRVQKKFIDCGGTQRESVSCSLQAWTAHDVEHRLVASKLAKILDMAQPVLESTDLPVEFEYGSEAASQYTLTGMTSTPQGIYFFLSGKQTDCLAPDKCGITPCCSTGCC